MYFFEITSIFPTFLTNFVEMEYIFLCHVTIISYLCMVKTKIMILTN